MISQRDEIDLIWFFSQGISAFEKSTFGPALERAELFGLAPYHPPALDPVYAADGETIIAHSSGITARPTAEMNTSRAEAPDDRTLIRYAAISRRLSQLERSSPISACVFSVYYGDAGQRWDGSKHGRVASLLPITKTGKKLITASEEASKKAGADLELSAAERIGVIVMQAEKGADVGRKEAVARAAHEADELYTAACDVWCCL